MNPLQIRPKGLPFKKNNLKAIDNEISKISLAVEIVNDACKKLTIYERN